jgi:hypothetical protein
MGYLGYKPADKPLTSADITDSIITSAKITDGTIANADINSSAAIALSKLSTTGTASASNYLRGDGAWSAVSSDYVLLATTDASSSASVSFDGYFSSTYKNYIVIFANIIPSSNGNEAFKIRYRRSNADITASNYRGVGNWTSITTGGTQTNSTAGFNNTNSANLTTASTTTSGYGISGDVIIYDALSTTNYKIFIAQTFTSDPSQELVHHKPAGRLVDSQDALSGLTFFFASGNITSGNFKLYGIK